MIGRNLRRCVFIAAGFFILPAMAATNSKKTEVDPRDKALFDLALKFEAKVNDAIGDRNAGALGSYAATLGRAVDKSIKLKAAGRRVNDCDLAVQSLHFIALSTGTAMRGGRKSAGLAPAIVREATPDYVSDMRKCAKRLGLDAGTRPSFGIRAR